MPSSYPDDLRPKAGLFAAAGFAVALATALPAFAADTTPASLSDARTIQVHETVLMSGRDHVLAPKYDIDLRIVRPNQINALISETTLKKPHQYVDDGKAEHEYNAKSNTVQDLPTAKKGGSYSTYRRLAMFDLVLTNGQLPAPKAGVQRTVTTETGDGLPMTLTTDTSAPQVSPLGQTFTTIRKLWSVTATGLPYRLESGYSQDGKTTMDQAITFTDWRFNQPIADSQMAFAPPADAKPYVPPPMPGMTTLAVGTVAPDFSAITPDGKTVHLSDFKGKVVVLDFWATWCHPCQDAMPHLDSVYKQIKSQDVTVLALCVWDSKPGYDKWVVDKKDVYSFPTAYDPAGRDDKTSIAGKLYNMNAIPTQYVIGRDGKIAAAYVGDEGMRLEKALIAQGIKVSMDTKTASAKP